VFGELNQTVTSMTLRANLTFTPTLSLQVYGEPFVAVGDYRGFKEVGNPRAANLGDRFIAFTDDQLLDDAGDLTVDLDRDGSGDLAIGNPDFTVLSFRSNVVLRWEYMLGSTLFVVWQHGRSDSSSESVYRASHWNDLFSAPASNTLVVKLNYWLSL
jgi:hypothetical protein